MAVAATIAYARARHHGDSEVVYIFGPEVWDESEKRRAAEAARETETGGDDAAYVL